MKSWQKTIILILAIISLFSLVKGFYESYWQSNAYGEVYPLVVVGVFVWGDAVVFGLFWLAVCFLIFYLDDWRLFLLITSVFWVVRAPGEAIWNLLLQFVPMARYPPEHFPLFVVFHNESVIFIQQIFWQVVTVVAIICSIYFAKQWMARYK